MKRLLIALAALLALSPPVAAQPARDQLTVLLDWFINPDHLPIIIAQERGDFARANLDVRIQAPADPNDPPRLVGARRADIGVFYQKNLHLAVDQGLPLVRVGTLVATPLSTLTVLRDGPVRTLADLRGRRVGYSVAGFEEVVMGVMLEGVGLRLSDIRLVNVNFGLSSALMSGQVDAILGGFRNFELHQLDIENRPGRAFFPEQYGMPAYDELIYITHRDRARDPVLRRFIDATEAATHFLVNNPEESWRMFIAGQRRELDNELNRRAFASTANRFSLSPGALDRNRYERFARFLLDRRMIRAVPALDTYAVELPAAISAR
ncbi:ABC transporter substrate-binding protein [Falsiroseomonas stagni]|uniref:Putative hydroxymethylpyrimidine transport system substrate-binding protein n=1 Tax=Falsiroseomonas stagni DSM 19981 TaxID=1123062 RepID=A0A1I4AXD3_9PROT|nr:ABC transporter substrate-binding protein [Falsiroseomonas stagni]SFK60349.1 putative hydroxymethylpyrimidine transport system substrate-binding protein [Falsiroseomonas stagni DSM 19981]